MRKLSVLSACVFAAILHTTSFADNYPRQAGVDAQHYIFKLTLSDADDVFTGETTAEILFTQDGIADVTLDLSSPGQPAPGGRGGDPAARGRGAAPVESAPGGAATTPATGPATAPGARGRGGRAGGPGGGGGGAAA